MMLELDDLQLTPGIVALALGDRILLVIGVIGRDVALAVRRVQTKNGAEVARTAVPGAARNRVAGGPFEALHVAVVLAMLIDAGLHIQLHALEVVLHDEVHDAGDGVRTVGRRGAAGQDVHPLDQLRRNLVDVGSRVRVAGVRVADAESAAIHQHQGALRAEAAQVDGGDPARRAQGVRGRAQIDAADLGDLRQLVQYFDRRGTAAQLDLGADDRLDGAEAGLVGLADARPGHHDFAHRRGWGCGGGGLCLYSPGANQHRPRRYGRGEPSAAQSRSSETCASEQSFDQDVCLQIGASPTSGLAVAAIEQCFPRRG
jgi:hypothetical protein